MKPCPSVLNNSFSRAFFIVMGCRLIVRMRKASYYNRLSELPRQLGAGGSAHQSPRRKSQLETSSVRGTADPPGPSAPEMMDASRVSRILTLAQRVGLPPALRDDWDAMWYQPIMTVNAGPSSPNDVDEDRPNGRHIPEDDNEGGHSDIELRYLPPPTIPSSLHLSGDNTMAVPSHALTSKLSLATRGKSFSSMLSSSLSLDRPGVHVMESSKESLNNGDDDGDVISLDLFVAPFAEVDEYEGDVS